MNNMDVAVVGGTYREVCLEPKIASLRGSGLRAAALLRSLGAHTTLHTCVDEAADAELVACLHAFAVEARVRRRPPEIVFSYETPVSPARWSYRAARNEIVAKAAKVVAFGMIDATWSVEGDAVVIDPQHGELQGMLAAARASSIAVVLNAHEAARLTGLPAVDAGRALLRHGLDVVVVKQGALGGLVFSSDLIEAYGAIPTPVTKTIGSGDAFTAGFAHAWFDNPDMVLDAARAGSRIAAAHSMTDTPQVVPAQIETLPEPLPHPGDTVPMVYLAAPFFSTAERLLIDTARSALRDAGVRVFSPLHDVGYGGDEVASADLEGLSRCQAVLALLDGGDPGTIFETGWARYAGIPVVGLVADPDLHSWTMLRGTEVTLTTDLTSAIYGAAWAAIRYSSGLTS